MLALGLRLEWLGSERLTWRDVAAIVRHSPITSALNRETRGDAAPFGPTEYLLVSVINVLARMSWQLGHKKGDPAPEPIVPPGTEGKRDSKTIRGDSMTIEEMNKRLGWT